MTKIVLLNTGHYSLDDRVYYHQAKSLKKNGFDVMIISSKEELNIINTYAIINSFDDNGLSNEMKLKAIVEHLASFLPDIIICDTPLAVIASKRYKKKYHRAKIIYDITEWYPSKKNFRGIFGVKKLAKLIVLFFVNLYAGFISDSFIFGEYYKSAFFGSIYFWKKFIFLPYFPDLEYIKYHPQKDIKSEINLLYSGLINNDKGIDSVQKVIELASKMRPDLIFKLKVYGKFSTENDQCIFNSWCASLEKNVTVAVHDFLPFTQFCETIGDTHIFFDLRKTDFENTHCLPIKLFYYMACGRPVIYSNLRSIKKDIGVLSFGYTIDPADYQSIANKIIDYCNDENLYKLHSENALELSRNKYNWKKIENNFISFIYTHV
jgi:glycosyltransferase involved in cell wall biosynthesis